MIRLVTSAATIFVLVAASDHACAGPAAISSGKSLTVQCAGTAAAHPVARLSGKDARQQLLVTALEADGRERDLTREVQYASEPAGVVRIDGGGWMTPLTNGQSVVTASAAGGSSCALTVVVERVESAPPVNFPNQVVPIFTKTGCNAGGCHGKASGQNGFKLSLLGFEPSEDFEHLVKEARGRRLFVAAPEQSLLLLKARAALPHGGGKRLEAGSRDYELIVRWINQGMPYGTTNDPVLTRIAVMPSQRVMRFDEEQQLVVTAHYSDGSVEDVTRSALYEANEKELAQTEEHGLVKFYRQPGDVAVMVRYQAKVAVFRASIPLGAPITELPAANNFVDDLVLGKLKQMGIPPSPLCDDATFLRRASLDITGRLPDRDETQRFLADPDRRKRAALIDRLLARPEYADYFANKWSALLRNRRNAPAQARGAYVFHAWIRDRLIENQPYDRFVRDILAASGDLEFNPPVAWYRQAKDATTQLEDTAQLFLGTRLQCAQCHHHPFEKWSQQDYFSFSAFFAQVGRKPGSQPGEEMIFHKRGIATATNKKTKRPAKPAGLGSATVDVAPEDDPRQALVDWMVTKDNPFFARSLVNRYWKHFFNRGVVDPEDDLRETNPPTNPELLEGLARHFVDSGFDLKALVRTLCQAAVYQFSAAPNEFNRGDKQHFSRYYPKRLTAEVLLDAINDLTGSQNNFAGMPAGIRAVQLPDNSFNAASYFLTVFGRPDMASSCECERSQDASLAQSLHLLNSKEVQDKLTADQGRAALWAADPSRTDEQKLRELYLLALAREPNAKEMSIAQDYLTKKHTKRQAYEDLIWALINTKEFLFNH